MGTNEFESSLRCEIWMLNRAKNYFEDQFLGFALIPLVGAFSMHGKMLTKKFSLASNDLFDSQVGFVEISLSYAGSLPQGFMMTTATSNTAATLTSMNSSTIVKEENREASEDGEAIFTQPLIKINVQPEQPVVQQEIVDMYIKSLQEFTDSLAKMKLPMDADNGICTQNEALDLNPCEKEKMSKENRSDSSSSRVFLWKQCFLLKPVVYVDDWFLVVVITHKSQCVCAINLSSIVLLCSPVLSIL
ncbi:hypothetical protein ZOSMA_112G00030 [Zostera marina]|uniref:Uncharacterized protein n=1 Tax=Zostera marina TaxID=29655 RepID=A0A0K9Q554_ZOSMR|nr:hypothetical protein ZOSMA_112G00030 [Zostera marina]